MEDVAKNLAQLLEDIGGFGGCVENAQSFDESLGLESVASFTLARPF